MGDNYDIMVTKAAGTARQPPGKEPLMSTKAELLEFLQSADGRFVSGQEIADHLKISRNSVWKAVTALKKDGYQIEGRSKAGYRIAGSGGGLSVAEIQSFLNARADVEVYDSVTSTNDIAKLKSLTHRPIAIIANKQTEGRGRYGRAFASPSGTGLYMTIALKPMFSLQKSPFVTMATAVAVCRAINKVCNIEPGIKWVNDIYYKKKKVCGILTEAQTSLETGIIDRLIIGIGINCFPGSFPAELRKIAGALTDTAHSFSRSELAAEVINELVPILMDLEAMSFMSEYRRRCFILGHRVRIHPTHDEEGIAAKALAIEDDGALLVEYQEGPKKGTRESIRSGEISVSIY